jgi:hypothetical protein
LFQEPPPIKICCIFFQLSLYIEREIDTKFAAGTATKKLRYGKDELGNKDPHLPLPPIQVGNLPYMGNSIDNSLKIMLLCKRKWESVGVVPNQRTEQRKQN